MIPLDNNTGIFSSSLLSSSFLGRYDSMESNNDLSLIDRDRYYFENTINKYVTYPIFNFYFQNYFLNKIEKFNRIFGIFSTALMMLAFCKWKVCLLNKKKIISYKSIINKCFLISVIRAEGLASADINGKSDPFVCLQLINQYRQTYTCYKTLNPEWNKTFEL